MEKFDIIQNWPQIRTHFNISIASNLHVSIASVNEQNMPTVTPIGSFFLNSGQKGFYFELYTKKLPQNAQTNNNICVLGVNSGTWFWLKSLFIGRFDQYIGVKLYGQLGQRRKPTEIEISRFTKRIGLLKGMKGSKMLFGHLPFVREISFTKAELIQAGEITSKPS